MVLLRLFKHLGSNAWRWNHLHRMVQLRAMICEHCGSQVDLVEAVEPESLVEHAPAEPGKYKVDVRIGGNLVRFFGPEGNLRARVFRGGINRQVFNGLKSLESPIMASIGWVGGVTVSIPRVFEMLDNQGKNRRFIQFIGNGGGLVLEFLEGARISRSLEYAIRGAFPAPKEPKENDHDEQEQLAAEDGRKEEHDDSAGAAGGEGQGDDREHREPALGEEHRQVAREAISPEEFRLLTTQEPAPAVRPEENSFTTIRKGGPMKNPPKQLYYRRPAGLGR